MRITVLGCWAPYPRPGGACSGYLVQDAGVSILLDAGNGSFSNLCKHIAFRDLDAVFISHLHLDHCADLFCLRHALKIAYKKNSGRAQMPLFMPQEPAEDIERLTGSQDGVFDLRTIEKLPLQDDLFTAVVGHLELLFTPTWHSLPGYGVIIGNGRSKIAYSGDTAYFAKLATYWRGVQLLLCEASGFQAESDSLAGVHLTAAQAGLLAAKSGAERLLLTHLLPEYEPVDLCAEAAENCSCWVASAEENKTFLAMC